MGSEAEAATKTRPRLPLLSKPDGYMMESPERSGMLTPPLHTSASVPFRWEEEPGKPRHYCTSLSSNPNPLDAFAPKCLDLPPRLLFDPKLPSSTTLLLEGPYMGKSRFQSSSFRVVGREWYGSFRRTCSPERGQLGTIVLSKRGLKEKGFLGSWGGWRKMGFKGKEEVGGGVSYVFPSFMDSEAVGDANFEEEVNSGKKVKIARIRRTGSFPTLSHARPQIWATIYEGLKQVVPWRSKKRKKDGLMI